MPPALLGTLLYKPFTDALLGVRVAGLADQGEDILLVVRGGGHQVQLEQFVSVEIRFEL